MSAARGISLLGSSCHLNNSLALMSNRTRERCNDPGDGHYREVKHPDGGDSNESLLEHDWQYERRKSCISKLLLAFALSVKIAFVLSYIVLAYYAWAHRRQSVCVLGNENIYDDPPILYDSKRFQRAGFHDPRHNTKTAYEGQPDSKNNAAWEGLLDVGVVSISSQENTRLKNGTAFTRQDHSEYVVELEMFHQLHCLKWLRDQSWEFYSSSISGIAPVFEPQQSNHTDHCIDYLRQVVMCHGDLTPITFEWISEINGYIAHHSTEHRCRDFNVIYGWAEGRNTSGFTVKGNHKNVDLKTPEMFD